MKDMFDTEEVIMLTMADGDDDYDEYEEEVVERDEEYDDDEEEEEEEYDDEEYDEEEPEEEYDDYEEEEPYDEGYDDSYYDDRLNKVLDELAELKRGLSAPAPVQQPVYPPYQPPQQPLVVPIPQGNSNEVVMYNEISRLRDELGKTQNEQSMHVELSRLKEDMERDKRANEAQFLSEIKRLNERIEELQKEKNQQQLPSGQPQQQLAAPAYAPEQKDSASKEDLNRLVDINTSILQNAHESDSHILGELNAIKAKVSATPDSEELFKQLGAIRRSVKALEEKLEEKPEATDSAPLINETAEKLTAQIADLKELMSTATPAEAPVQSGCALDKKLADKLAQLSVENGGVDLTEVMRSIYELKGMLGSNDRTQQDLVNMALKTYTDLDLLHATLANTTDYRAKLEAIESFASAVNAQDFITSDALSAFNLVLKELLDTELDRSILESVCSFASATGKITVPSAKKDALTKFLTFAERATKEDVDSVLEFLPEMITALNDAENSRNIVENGAVYDRIIEINGERTSATTDADKRSAENEIHALILQLAHLRVADIVTYAPTMPLPTSEALNFAEGDSVSDRLNAMMEAITDLSMNVMSLSAGNATEEKGGSEVLEEDEVASDETAASVSAEQSAEIADSLGKLKTMLVALNAKVNLDEMLEEMRNSFADVSNRLAELDEKTSATPVGTSYVQEEGAESDGVSKAEVLAAIANLSEKVESIADPEVKQTMLDDLAAISAKLNEQDLFITQIADLRADILSIPEAVNGQGQSDKLYEDLCAQFDKLYEDLSAVSDDSLAKLSEKFDALKEAVDALSSADTQLAVLDGVSELRTVYEDNQSLSAVDRAKLLEDVAFVREQVEKRLEEQASSDAVQNEDIYAQIDELKAEFLENIKALEDRLAAIETADTTVKEYYEQTAGDLSGQITALTDSLNEKLLNQSLEEQQRAEDRQSILATLAELQDKTTALSDTIAANELAAAENSVAVSDELARILEQLSPSETAEGEEEAPAYLYDEITAISARLDELSASYEQANENLAVQLADIKEQVHLKELEQNLESVTASEEEQQTLLKEIAELRERLSQIETSQKDSTEAISAQVGLLADQLTLLSETATEDSTTESLNAVLAELAEIKEQLAPSTEEAQEEEGPDTLEAVALNVDLLIAELAEIKERLDAQNGTEGEAVSEDLKTLAADVAEIKDKLFRGASDDSALNMQVLMADVAEVKDRLSASVENSSDFVKMQDDLTFIRNQIEANMEPPTESDSFAETLENEDLSLLMDDVAAIKEKLNALDEYDTVAEILSLREDVKSARLLDTNDVAAELEALKGDLMELKADLSDWKTNGGDAVVIGGAEDAPTSDEVNMLLSEIVSLRDEIQSYKDDVAGMIAGQGEQGEAVTPQNLASDENITAILDEITELRETLSGVKDESLAVQAEEIETIKESIAEIKDMVSRRTTLAESDVEGTGVGSSELNVVLDEIINLKDEIAALKSDMVQLQPTEEEASEEDSVVTQAILEELAAIREALAAERTEAAPTVTLEELYGEVLALREEAEAAKLQQPVATTDGNFTVDLTPINEQLAAIRESLADSQAVTPVNDEVLDEVASLREELALLREEVQAPVEQPDAAVMSEIAALREEIAGIKETLVAPKADTALGEELALLREELQALRVQASAPVAIEADATVLNEILGIREQIEQLREESAEPSIHGTALMDSVDAIKEDVRSIKEEPDLSVVNEVLALRDEFQSMKEELSKVHAAPADDKSKEELVAEVQSLRDQLFAISMANVNDGSGNDVVYESYNNIILDEITALRDEIAIIKQTDEQKSMADELADIKDKLTNLAIDEREQSEARFKKMHEEIEKLAKQAQNEQNESILSDLAELKEAVANQRDADAATLNYMSELAKLLEHHGEAHTENSRLADEIETLKSEIASSLAATSVTETVAELASDIADLKDALRRGAGESFVVDNVPVLEEIEALKAELARKKPRNDNKQVLNEIARLKEEIGAMIEGTAVESEEPAATKPAPRKNTRKKKAAEVPAQQELSSDELITKIDNTSIDNPVSSTAANEEVLLMNPYEAQEIPATSEEMEIASRLAKQVANKLIMEQLVQQLDGSVPRSEVEEIVKDIMPQEFTTIQIDEQSDKVRRLANSLVLDKLRSRLTDKK